MEAFWGNICEEVHASDEIDFHMERDNHCVGNHHEAENGEFKTKLYLDFKTAFSIFLKQPDQICRANTAGTLHEPLSMLGGTSFTL